MHPAIAFDQAAAIIGLGLILARFPDDDERPLFPTAFMSLFAGIIVGSYFPEGWAGVMIPVSLMVVGLCLVDVKGFIMKAPQVALVIYGIVNGLSFGAEIPEDASGFLFAGGMLSTTTIATGYTILLWRKFSRPWCDIAVRIVGSWCIAIGLMVLGLELRPDATAMPIE